MAGKPRRRRGGLIALALACAACVSLAVAPRPANATTGVGSLHRWESVVSYHPIDADRGWVLTNRRLLVTSDRGATWIDVTPPGLHRSIRNGGVDFLDADHAWVAVAGSWSGERASKGFARVWRTMDGGGSWSVVRFRLAQPPPFGLYATPRFGSFDVASGWMLIGEPGNTGNDPGALLYVTHDGGAGWRYAGYSPAGYGDTAFSSPTTGVASGGALVQQLWRTTDAGCSWGEIHPRRPPACPRHRAIIFRGPAVVGSTLLLGEECDHLQGDRRVPVAVLASSNGGATWRRVGHLPRDTGFPLFVDPTTWVGSGEKVGFELTQDAGARWRAFETPRRACPGWMNALSLLSPRIGWIVTGTVEGNHATCDSPGRLLGTSDGGKHWTLLLSRRK
jgi:photosystem II stability/assembly factor-like uncharacterized protein